MLAEMLLFRCATMPRPRSYIPHSSRGSRFVPIASFALAFLATASVIGGF